jgi:hypothetical protein
MIETVQPHSLPPPNLPRARPGVVGLEFAHCPTLRAQRMPSWPPPGILCSEEAGGSSDAA